MVGGDGRCRLPGPRPVQEHLGRVLNVQHRSGEPVIGEELAAPGVQVFCPKRLDAVIAGICHVDGAVGRNGHVGRIAELPVGAALRPPRA
jgi:hypothetical protein